MRVHRFLNGAGAVTVAAALLAATIVAAAQVPSQTIKPSATDSGTRDPFQAASEKADAESSKKGGAKADDKKKAPPEFIRKTDAQWKKILDPYVYTVTREKMTEPAFWSRT